MDNSIYITTARLRAIVGNVSAMTIWRWEKDDALGFPKPVRVNSRKYWKAVEIEAWLEGRRQLGKRYKFGKMRTGRVLCTTETTMDK